MDKLAFSIDEACMAVGLSKPTLYKLIKEGSFPAIKVGTRTIIPAEGLISWMRDKAEHTEA